MKHLLKTIQRYKVNAFENQEHFADWAFKILDVIDSPYFKFLNFNV